MNGGIREAANDIWLFLVAVIVISICLQLTSLGLTYAPPPRRASR